MDNVELIEAIAELEDRIEEVEFMGWMQEAESMKREVFKYTAKLFEMELKESGRI